MMGLSYGEEIMIVGRIMWTVHECDRQTDGQNYDNTVPLFRHCLPVFGEICGMAMNFVFHQGNTKIANTPLDTSAALVLSVIN